MGTILQFYLIAPFIYKAMEKKPWLTAIGSVLLTVCFKYLIMGVIIPETVEEGIRGAYFWVYGRQLITALDNFVIGMFIAKLLSEYDFESKIKKTNIIATILSFFALCFVILVGCNYYNVPYFFGGIYESSIKAYTYHSILVIFIGIPQHLMFPGQKLRSNPRLTFLHLDIKTKTAIMSATAAEKTFAPSTLKKSSPEKHRLVLKPVLPKVKNVHFAEISLFLRK